jgi:hypothetical protein
MSAYPEKYWHCRVKRSGQKQDANVKDLSFAELEAKIITPYKAGRRFPVSGQVVSADQIEEIQIVQTPEDDATNSKRFYEMLRQSNAGSGVVSFACYSGPWGEPYAKDYTQELLFSEETTPQSTPAREGGPDALAKEVFVVHGHDEGLRSEVCLLLERLRLHPIVLFEQADKGRTIIEKFEDHSNVTYAVVLITPDDEGGLRGCSELKPRARQNVIFELGFFYGKLGRQNVCAILKEGVEFPSDIQGVIYKVADPAGAWKLQFAKEMKAAGIDIDFNRLA